MDRQQMVEKAARAQVRHRRGVTGRVHDVDREAAAAVLDAVLPVVSTVAELKALPDMSLVVGATEIQWQRCGEGWQEVGEPYIRGSEEVAEGAPLTVVWRP